MTEVELAKQAKALIENVKNVGMIIFLIIMFKDVVTTFATNVFNYIRAIFSSRRNCVPFEFDGTWWKIKKISFFDNEIHLVEDIEEKSRLRVRMSISQYLKMTIKYKA